MKLKSKPEPEPKPGFRWHGPRHCGFPRQPCPECDTTCRGKGQHAHAGPIPQWAKLLARDPAGAGP